MKTVFFGSGDFVSPVIKSLRKNFELVEVITPKTEIRKKADLGVVASYGRIVSKEVIESFPYGILNIHPSLLPKYRGPTPVQTAILNGDKTTGVTIIKLDEKVDHGPILWQKKVEISPSETSESLLKKTFEEGAKALPKVISNYIKEQIKPSPQDDSKATYTKILTKKDGFIDLSNVKGQLLSVKLERMIRAFYPWPSVWFRAVLNDKRVAVKLLPNKKIQVEGKKPMSFEDFINGYKNGREILRTLGF